MLFFRLVVDQRTTKRLSHMWVFHLVCDRTVLYVVPKSNKGAFCDKLDRHVLPFFKKKYKCCAFGVFLTFLCYLFCIDGICAVKSVCERKSQGVFCFVINVNSTNDSLLHC